MRLEKYEGFEYEQHLNGTVTLYLGGPRAVFRAFDAFKAFCDGANNIIEKVVLKDLRLHLTGCKRCFRATQHPAATSPKNQPCKTGAEMFRLVRENSNKVVEVLLSQLDEAEPTKENAEQGERANRAV